jgi:hypothetical protein
LGEILVSHFRKFIFLKTIKTGGTSVEIFFEEFCVTSPINYTEISHANEVATPNICTWLDSTKSLPF